MDDERKKYDGLGYSKELIDELVEIDLEMKPILESLERQVRWAEMDGPQTDEDKRQLELDDQATLYRTAQRLDKRRRLRAVGLATKDTKDRADLRESHPEIAKALDDFDDIMDQLDDEEDATEQKRLLN